MAKVWPLRNHKNYISFERYWWELSKNVLFIDYCVKSYGHFCQILALFTMSVHQIWFKMQISKIFYFVVILNLISGKVTKFLVEKHSTKDLMGGGNTPSEFRVNELLPEIPYDSSKSDVKQQKLIECILTGNSKQYLRKADTKEHVNKLSSEEVDKLLGIYEAKLSGHMVKCLEKTDNQDVFNGGLCCLRNEQSGRVEHRSGIWPFSNLRFPEVHGRTLLQILFVRRTPKRWTDYEQTLLVRASS